MNIMHVTKNKFNVKMTISTKPILYNGFKIRKDLTIKNRIERIFFTDVYELSNEKYLYLFVNLNPNDLIDKSEKYDILRIKNETESYIGVIVNTHSKNQVFAISEDLTVAKGFECVAGMQELKNQLIADVINPLRNPEKFKKFKVSIPNGLILYGPPGCGKTFIIRKLAEELGYNFTEVKHSDIGSSFIHGNVSNIGKEFENARQNAPTILFFDEISGLVPDRRKLVGTDNFKEEEVNEFLMQLNDAGDKNILVVGATNYIDRIDPAVLRPGRFDKKIYVSPPDFEARESLFRIGLTNRPFDKNMVFSHLSNISEGFTCADIIEDAIESSARFAANNDMELIDQNILENEINRILKQKSLQKNN
jgi:SpoVK/Ycf46/Vps4 family AAA+-type ATPase